MMRSTRTLDRKLLARLACAGAVLMIEHGAVHAGTADGRAPAAEASAALNACVPTDPADTAAFEAIEDRMLTPGRHFGIDGIAPATLMRLGAMQKTEATRRASDWANLCRYATQNAELSRGRVRPDVIFLGDSITEIWLRADPALFGAKVLDRGISGQTSPQILLRFYPDVIALKPRVVHVIAGSNDVFGNTGPVTNATILQNIRAMIDIAQANGVRVVLGAIPPSKGFAAKPGINPAARIIALNAKLSRLAAERNIVFADYHAALRGADGGMAAAYTNDDLHPNLAGYATMRAVADRAITQAMR